jgi:protein TonB
MLRFLLLYSALLVSHFSVSAQSDLSNNKDTSVRTAFSSAEKPQYPGGEQALYTYVAQNVTYPPLSAEQNIEGTVVISFVVEKDGSLSNIKVVKSVHPLLDREALRVIGEMPKWKPGKQDGKEVRVQFNLPVNFRLK